MRGLKALVAAALLLCSAAAFAHRFHAGITDISFNARTGNTEIVHTYMTHDVEALLANLYGRQFDLNERGRPGRAAQVCRGPLLDPGPGQGAFESCAGSA